MKFKTVLAATAFAAIAPMMIACQHSATKEASRDAVSKTSQAAARTGAEEYTSVTFDKGSSALSEADRTKLHDMVAKTQANGKVDEYKVLAWADKEFPAEGQKATKADIELAKARAESIRKFLADDLNTKADVEKYNMAERPGSVASFFGTSDSKVKTTFENTGAAPTAANPAVIGNKSSQALILVDYENN